MRTPLPGNLNDLWSVLIDAQAALRTGAADVALIIFAELFFTARKSRDPKVKAWLEPEVIRGIVQAVRMCGIDLRRSGTPRRSYVTKLRRLLHAGVAEIVAVDFAKLERVLLRGAAFLMLMIELWWIVWIITRNSSHLLLT